MNGLKRIDILCDGNGKVGFGHIRRSLTLATQLKRDGLIVRLIGLSKTSSAILPSIVSDNSELVATIIDYPFDINEKIGRLISPRCLTLALDHFGSFIPDINIAVYAHKELRAFQTSYVGLEYVLIREEIVQFRSSRPSSCENRVMVMIGGADILGHGHLAAQTLAKLGYDVTLILGPFSSSYIQSSTYKVFINPTNLPKIFANCDWAVTSGGGSLFEGICLGKAVHVLPQTEAEIRIAEFINSQGGILGIGLNSLRRYDYAELNKVGKNAYLLIDGLGAHRVSKIVRSLI
jgi:spore coat polysaccharide biosynthesis predicted glycosyltransferase SpsG